MNASETKINSELIEQLYYSETHSPDLSEYPVLKINTEGRILYANRASFQLLREWLTTPEENLPAYFLKSNPDLLNVEADFSMPLITRTLTLNFDVVGFPEFGYIGLYGYANSYNDLTEENECFADLEEAIC